MLEGNFRFHIADREHHATPGDVILVPRDVPHTYRVESPAGARWLTITTHGDFERFVRAIGRPPDRAGLPDPAAPPTPQALEHLAAAALPHGIELVGPPLR